MAEAESEAGVEGIQEWWPWRVFVLVGMRTDGLDPSDLATALRNVAMYKCQMRERQERSLGVSIWSIMRYVRRESVWESTTHLFL